MKKVLFTFLTAFLAFPLMSQESLLDDLLNVQPVELKTEGSEELQAEYQQVLDEEKAKVDDELAKLDEDYKKEVGSLIEGFNKILEEPVEQEVKNEKKRLVTTVRTMTMTLKKNKKDVMTQFNNVLTKTIRELPKGSEGKKRQDVDDYLKEFKDKFETEYNSNLNVLATFQKTEHLTKSQETGTASEN